MASASPLHPPSGASGAPDARALIREAGFKATAGRVRVLDVLMAAGQPLSHAEVEAALAADGPLLDRVTVYRVLDSLVAGGLALKAVDTRGVFRYSHAGHGREHGSHVHFRCVACGGVFCLDAPPPPPPRLPRGFRLRDIEFDVRGTCPRCSP